MSLSLRTLGKEPTWKMLIMLNNEIALRGELTLTRNAWSDSGLEVLNSVAYTEDHSRPEIPYKHRW
jgi:hypothetical protein